ncbi:MAG: MBOAT family protein [Gammaproteobacteria bacterium]|nr:MBOAT family protein [Gammaproteobacteria bacterium]
MLFNSYTFLFFLLIVVITHNVLISSWRWQKVFLLLASYVFYAAWNPAFILLIWASTLTDWLAARWMYRTPDRVRKRAFLLLSLSVNLALLGFFKYGEFLLENIVQLAALAGVEYRPPEWNIVLPVGISFYTFQSLSYTLDVYRNKLKPDYSLLDFALYVTFFPQLVAGPIVRAAYFLPQCLTPRRANSDQLNWGLTLVVVGLFAKVVLADTFLAPVVDQVYAAPAHFNSFAAWTAALAFSGQIFFDFSGYSTCAIGSALCLGFALPDNFRAPYAALGFSDFWRRWHISLSTWLRDYLYISLGGGRHSSLRTQVNLMLTMLIGGLWHGASWMFVLWGALHGLYLTIERHFRGRIYARAEGNQSFCAGYVLFTFVVVTLTWIPFRATSVTDMWDMLSAVLYWQSGRGLNANEYVSALGIMMATLAWQYWMRASSLEALVERTSWMSRGGAVATVLTVTALFAGGDERAFIYFQF